MRNVSRPGQKVGFGDFELDFDSGQLRKGGSKLKLQEQPFQVLALLVERAGKSSRGRNCASSSGRERPSWTLSTASIRP
jgi:DNA-binding response OmpR family regulator